MSKGKISNSERKQVFGKKKTGRAKNAYNKHDRKEKNYRGQGR